MSSSLADEPSSALRARSGGARSQSASAGFPIVPERYAVRRLLGQGGMGSVYEVYDHRRERALAMKVLRDPERGSLYRFKREFRAAADLLHPNLIRLFDLGVLRDGNSFFTMELLRGHDLHQWAAGLRDGDATTMAGADSGATVESGAVTSPLPQRSLSHVLARILEGLSFLHRARKVHRDLKPSNIIVDVGGAPKILDFGILRELDAPAGMTALRGAVGTPLYMAPEQVSGSHAVGPAADLYAFGCMLYELLAGAPPFTGPSVRVMVQHLTELPPLPSSVRPCDAALESLCMALLAKEPELRPSARDVLLRLCQEAGGPPVRAADAVPRISPGLVGRDAELAVLLGALDEAQRAPRVVFVGGESGAGKSALAAELALLAQARGRSAWFGRCYEREQVPYKAFDAIVDSAAAMLARRGDAAHRLLPEGSASLARLFPVLREVDAVGDLAAQTTLRDAQAERRRAIRALFTLLQNLSQDGPPLLVLDDWQWADAESVEVLRWLAWAKEAPPCLCLVTVRSGDPSAEARQSEVGDPPDRVLRLSLPPLDEAALERVVEAFSAKTLSPAERARLAAEARGNPFLAVELGRAVEIDDAQNTLPTLEALVERRLAGLSADARTVLEAAAVAGGRARFSLLRAGTSLPDARLAEGLDELLRAGLLREAAQDGDESYDLAHDRFREAAYGAVPIERRRGLHRAMASFLADEGDAARAAMHWRRADDPEQARAAALAAARAAEAQLAFDRAGTLYALAEGDDAPFELSFARATALSKAGRHREAAAVLEASLTKAPPDTARDAALQAAIEHTAAGDMQRAFDAFDSLLSAFGERIHRRNRSRLVVALSALWLVATWFLRDLFRLPECGKEPPSQATLFRLRLYEAVQHHLLTVEPFVAIEFGAKHTRLARRLGDFSHVGRARISHATRLAAVFGRSGRRRAFRHLDRGEALCAEAGDARGLLDGFYTRGLIHMLESNVVGVRAAASSAHALAREKGLFGEPTLALLHNLHAGAEFLSGDAQATIERAGAYLREARLRGNVFERAEPMMVLGCAHLLEGDLTTARALIDEGLSIVPEEPFILTRLRMEISAIELDLFEGAYERGLERWDRAHARWQGGGLFASGLDRTLMALQRGRLELLRLQPGEKLPRELRRVFPLGLQASMAPPLLRALFRRYVAAVHFRRGKLRAAKEQLDLSLRFAEAINNPLGVCLALVGRATVRRRLGLAGADLDAKNAKLGLAALGLTGCYLIRAEGWDDPG